MMNKLKSVAERIGIKKNVNYYTLSESDTYVDQIVHDRMHA